VDETLRVGLIGAGPWARTVHAPGLADHPGTTLSAVWARRPGPARELAEAYGAAVADSVDELMEQVDAVAFAVPPAVQGKLAIKAAEAGKHLILEKPIAADLETAERLADAVSAAGVATLVVLTLRFAAQTREWLADIAESGGWQGGGARWLSGALLGGPYEGSAWREADGALADIGPHVFDLMDATLGTITKVLAVKSAAQVDEMLTRLKVMGFDARVVRDTSGLFKVRVGRYATHDEAAQTQRRLKTRLGGQPFVVEEP